VAYQLDLLGTVVGQGHLGLLFNVRAVGGEGAVLGKSQANLHFGEGGGAGEAAEAELMLAKGEQAGELLPLQHLGLWVQEPVSNVDEAIELLFVEAHCVLEVGLLK
jgi:hypothetical protein